MKRHVLAASLGAAALACVATGAPPPPPAPLFEDVAARAGLGDAKGARVAFADLDGDGFPDAIVDHTRTYRNVRADDGTRRFVRGPDIADGGSRPTCVQLGDVNGDGRLDAFLGHGTEASQVWLGAAGGGFARKEKPGVDGHVETTVSACFVDYDRDGILDLVVANAYVVPEHGVEAYPTRLFHGRGDGSFEDVTEKAGMLGIAEPGHPDSRRPAYGVTHTDWNDDGWQDLLVLSYGRQANRLWRNNGDGTFTDVGEATHFAGDDDRSGKYSQAIKDRLHIADEPPWRSNGNTFDGAVADYDGDGDMDVFLAEITHWWAGPSSDLSMLLVNEGKEKGFAFKRRPELIRRKHAGPHWNQGDLHAGWLDVDDDGLLDLLIASSDYPDEQLLKLYHQLPDHTFEEWTDRLGVKWINASQISLGDFDGDGATDILVGTNAMRLTPAQAKAHSLSVGLLRNVCAPASGNRFLTLRLVGGGKGEANRDAIGARVTILCGEKRQTREVLGGLGHAGHHDDFDCRFGVAKAEAVDRLEVRWPDAAGTVQVFEHVATNRFYVLEQGGELREGRSPRR